MRVLVPAKKKTPVAENDAVSEKMKPRKSLYQKSSLIVILDLAAESYSFGQESVSRTEVAKRSGLRIETVTNTIDMLQQKGLIDYPDDNSIRLTKEGIRAAGNLEKPPKTNEECHKLLKKQLKGKQLKLFNLLCDGFIHDRMEIANALEYENDQTKAFVNHIVALSDKGILTFPDHESLQLTEKCFPFGQS